MDDKTRDELLQEIANTPEDELTDAQRVIRCEKVVEDVTARLLKLEEAVGQNNTAIAQQFEQERRAVRGALLALSNRIAKLERSKGGGRLRLSEN